MFVYVRKKNGKVVRVTVPDWDIVNPLAIQHPTIQQSKPSTGIIPGTGSESGFGDGIPDIILLATARYLDV